MKITNIKKEGSTISFEVSGINASIANALRRAVISKVPTLAIEDVRFYDNSSILNDEILAHRLGLIPLNADLDTYKLQKDCKCKGKGCSTCTATLTLDVKGPGTVYAEKLKSKGNAVAPVYKKTPITKLTDKQAIKLEAVAVLGAGKDHIKWQPGIASYEEEGGSFKFFVESYGQMSAEELLRRAFETVGEDIAELKKALK